MPEKSILPSMFRESLLLRVPLQSPHVPFDPPLCRVEVFEFLFVGAEGRGMVVASSVVVDRGVLYVEHFMEDDVLDDIFGHLTRIERPTYNDRFMCSVVVAQDAIRLPDRPGEDGLWDPPAEIGFVEVAEDIRQVVNLALIGGHNLPTTQKLVLGGSLTHFGRFDVVGIDLAGPLRHPSPKDLCDKNVSKSYLAILRHVAADVSYTDVNLPIADANGVMYPCVRIEPYLDLRNRTAMIEGSKGLSVYLA